MSRALTTTMMSVLAAPFVLGFGGRASLSTQPSAEVDEDAILGLWATEPNDREQFAHVEVYRCEDRFCGRIVWLSHPLYGEDEAGQWGGVGDPRIDWENPDPDLRSQPMEGLELLYSFRFDDDKWKDGRIYDPENGKTYRCELQLAEEGTVLKVRGYVKIVFVKIGRTTEWTRVPDPPGM